MKKFLLLALLSVSMLPTYSQTSIGIIGGYNLARYYRNPSAIDGFNSSLKSAWRAGVIADRHLWKKVYLQPQLLLNAKGENASYVDERPYIFYSFESNLRSLYLELQANFIFKQQLGKGKFFAGAGPYIGRGLNGKSSAKGHMVIDDEKIDFDLNARLKFS